MLCNDCQLLQWGLKMKVWLKISLGSYKCLLECIFEENVYVEPDLASKPQTKSKFLKGTESQRPFNLKKWIKINLPKITHLASNGKHCSDFLGYFAEQPHWGQFSSRLWQWWPNLP